MTTDFAIEIEAPSWVTVDHLKRAAPVLVEVLRRLRGSEEAMRGYLHCALKDGFDVDPDLVLKEELLQECIRAFWYCYERTSILRRPDSEVLH